MHRRRRLRAPANAANAAAKARFSTIGLFRGCAGGRGRESFMDPAERIVVGQVEVQRADRNIAVGDRLEIG